MEGTYLKGILPSSSLPASRLRATILQPLAPKYFAFTQLPKSMVSMHKVSGGRIHERQFKLSIVSSMPELETFEAGCAKGNLVPVYQRIFGDHLTPILAYRCLVKEDDREAHSFLFESVKNGQEGTDVGRYSILGIRPSLEITAKGNKMFIIDHEVGSRVEKIVIDPFKELAAITLQWKPSNEEYLPDCFTGGWVGYLSYDTVRYMEMKKLPFHLAPTDDRCLPDIHMGLYKEVIVFDHVSKIIYAIHWTQPENFESKKEAYNEGKRRLEKIIFQLTLNKPNLSFGTINLSISKHSHAPTTSNFSKEDYKKMVLKAQEHIVSGDIFQIVLSQRIERCTFVDPFEIYRALRVVNPSPYMMYIQCEGSILVASSPEILTSVRKGRVLNRPLAGTRKRGHTKDQDLLLENDLLNDEKECAEHVMLVDLARNDVGKVSKAGTVQVEKFMVVERYSHVMHISSTVSGELLHGLTPWDALHAALPVGTVSGAPKVRAMQLLDTMEPTRRGPYSGGIGSISFNGDMEMALGIRTMVIPTLTKDIQTDSQGRREWIIHLQAGAGIVADSIPDLEYQECLNKAAGLGRAIDLAESTFQ